MVWFNDKFPRYAERVPVLGTFFTVSPKARSEALFEMFLTVIFSTLPIWLWGVVSGLDNYIHSREFPALASPSLVSQIWCAIYTGISNGELFMLAASVLGPILYLGLTELGKSSTEIFPWVRWSVSISVLLTLLSTGLFLLIRYRNYSGAPQLVYTSLVIYLVSLLLLLPAMAHNHNSDPAVVPTAHEEGEKDFLRGYGRHRRQ